MEEKDNLENPEVTPDGVERHEKATSKDEYSMFQGGGNEETRKRQKRATEGSSMEKALARAKEASTDKKVRVAIVLAVAIVVFGVGGFTTYMFLRDRQDDGPDTAEVEVPYWFDDLRNQAVSFNPVTLQEAIDEISRRLMDENLSDVVRQDLYAMLAAALTNSFDFMGALAVLETQLEMTDNVYRKFGLYISISETHERMGNIRAQAEALQHALALPMNMESGMIGEEVRVAREKLEGLQEMLELLNERGGE